MNSLRRVTPVGCASRALLMQHYVYYIRRIWNILGKSRDQNLQASFFIIFDHVTCPEYSKYYDFGGQLFTIFWSNKSGFWGKAT